MVAVWNAAERTVALESSSLAGNSCVKPLKNAEKGWENDVAKAQRLK